MQKKWVKWIRIRLKKMIDNIYVGTFFMMICNISHAVTLIRKPNDKWKRKLCMLFYHGFAVYVASSLLLSLIVFTPVLSNTLYNMVKSFFHDYFSGIAAILIKIILWIVFTIVPIFLIFLFKNKMIELKSTSGTIGDNITVTTDKSNAIESLHDALLHLDYTYKLIRKNDGISAKTEIISWIFTFLILFILTIIMTALFIL